MKKIYSLLSACLISTLGFAQTTVTINPSADNTLYQSGTGSLSNGTGSNIFIGRTNNGQIRRAVLRFDLSSIPANATISSAVLELNVNKQKGGSDSARVHLLNDSWGEGSTNAGGNEGGGAPSTSGSATWIHEFFSTSQWTNAGGDFNSTASAASLISGNGTVSFNSSLLTSNVQAWLDGTLPNDGWIILGNESRNASAKRMNSRESGSSTARPRLIITYNLTGITESVESKIIQIYPSPATDFLIIEHRRNIFTNEARVFDTNGKLVLEQMLGNDNKLDVSGLKTGMYILELPVNNSNERVTKKFMKQ